MFSNRIPKPERRQREEHAREPDGGDGDHRADGDHDERGEQDREQPRDPVVADEMSEGGGADRGESRGAHSDT